MSGFLGRGGYCPSHLGPPLGRDERWRLRRALGAEPVRRVVKEPIEEGACLFHPRRDRGSVTADDCQRVPAFDHVRWGCYDVGLDLSPRVCHLVVLRGMIPGETTKDVRFYEGVARQQSYPIRDLAAMMGPIKRGVV